MQLITTAESVLVSYIRIIAFLSIISCHFLQYYDNRWAWVLNMGVQVFFALSGFLYGRKQIDRPLQWGMRRIRKLYVPFILFVVMAAAALMLLVGYRLTWKVVLVYLLNLQGIMGQNIPGLTHLWFMTAIMICYAVTPVLQYFRRFSPGAMLLVVVGVYAVDVMYVHVLENVCTWLTVYAFSYYASQVGGKVQSGMAMCLLIIASVLWVRSDWSQYLSFGLTYQVLHVAGGLLCVLVPLAITRFLANFNIIGGVENATLDAPVRCVHLSPLHHSPFVYIRTINRIVRYFKHVV